MLTFKNEKLLANVSRHNDDKAKSLAEEYRMAVDDINEIAAANMNEEIRMMDGFSAKVNEFNDLCASYLVKIATLRIRMKGGK